MLERGVAVSYETIRAWCLKFWCRVFEAAEKVSRPDRGHLALGRGVLED
jgi:transposase-like protein